MSNSKPTATPSEQVIQHSRSDESQDNEECQNSNTKAGEDGAVVDETETTDGTGDSPVQSCCGRIFLLIESTCCWAHRMNSGDTVDGSIHINTSTGPFITHKVASIFSQLPDEIIAIIFADFLGPGYYRYVAGTSRSFRRVYSQAIALQQQKHKDKETEDTVSCGLPIVTSTTTSINSIVESVSNAEFYWNEARSDSNMDASMQEEEHHAIIRLIGVAAASYGNLEVLQWTRTKSDYGRWDPDVCNGAARNGHLEVLQWARDNEFSWDSRTCAVAARNGHLKVLQWARGKSCDWDSKTCRNAAAFGHLEVLQWARKRGCNWNSATCHRAAQNGHLEVLQWARQNGCDWDSYTCSRAAQNGHLEVLQWARQNGCPWDKDTCFLAAANGHLKVLQWVRQNRCPWDASVCNGAAGAGHLRVLYWACCNGCPCDLKTCSIHAERNGQSEVLNWVRTYGSYYMR